MPLELRNLTNNSVLQVPDEGVVFGREGGNADVQFKDGSVSKRHARVYLDGDAWFLEDLGSSNGTFLQQQRLKAPAELLPGSVFAMSKVRLEVVGPVVSADEPPAPAETPPPPAPATPPPPAPAPAPRPSLRPQSKESSTGAAKKVTGKAPPSTSERVARSAPPPAPPEVAPRDEEERDEEEERDAPQEDDESQERQTEASMGRGGGTAAAAQSKGVGYFFIAVPKAIAFYLASVPLLLLNPVGTIRQGIAQQKHEAMGPMELIAYALPVNIFSAAVGFIAAVIAQLIARALNLGALIGGLIFPLVGAVIGSVVCGLIWHPVLDWVIPKLSGASTARSRTNYFLMFETTVALLAIPNGVAVVLAVFPLRVVAAIGPLLLLAASLVTVFVHFKWLVHFKVVKWFRILILVLGGLGVLGTAWGVVSVLLHGAPGAALSVSSAGSAGAAGSTGAAGDEAAEAAAKAEAEAEAKAAEAAEAATKAGVAKPGEGPEKSPGTKAGAEPGKDPAKDPIPERPTAPPTGGGYASYAKMRDAVEKRLSEDPTILRRSPDLEDLYRAYESRVYELEAKYQRLTAKKPSEAKTNAYLRDGELYEQTEKQVKELHSKLFK